MRIRYALPAESGALANLGSAADSLYRTVGHPEIDSGAAATGDYATKAVAERRVWVAEIDGQLVGFVCVDRLDDELFVKQVSVLPERGRRGIGTALMLAVIEAARAAGEPSMVLDTQDDVPWNRPWYERLGFRTIAKEHWTTAMRALTERQVGHGFDWQTRVHMRLDLRD